MLGCGLDMPDLEHIAVSVSPTMALSGILHCLQAFELAVSFVWNALPKPYLHSIFLHHLQVLI